MQTDDRGGAILVVEDNDDIRGGVKAFLESAGYSVICASDGVVGLASFKQNRAVIALVLSDVTMPNMNGLELADRVLEIDETLPVLFMSGIAYNADRGYGCVQKPFRGSELVARIGAVLQRAAA